jgi:hypothetical protein
MSPFIAELKCPLREEGGADEGEISGDEARDMSGEGIARGC